MKIKLQYILINFNDNELQKNTPLNNFIRTSTEVVRNWTSNTPFFSYYFFVSELIAAKDVSWIMDNLECTFTPNEFS